MNLFEELDTKEQLALVDYILAGDYFQRLINASKPDFMFRMRQVNETAMDGSPEEVTPNQPTALSLLSPEEQAQYQATEEGRGPLVDMERLSSLGLTDLELRDGQLEADAVVLEDTRRVRIANHIQIPIAKINYMLDVLNIGVVSCCVSKLKRSEEMVPALQLDLHAFITRPAGAEKKTRATKRTSGKMGILEYMAAAELLLRTKGFAKALAASDPRVVDKILSLMGLRKAYMAGTKQGRKGKDAQVFLILQQCAMGQKKDLGSGPPHHHQHQVQQENGRSGAPA